MSITRTARSPGRPAVPAGSSLVLRPAFRTVNALSAILFHDTGAAPFARLGQDHLQLKVKQLRLRQRAGKRQRQRRHFPTRPITKHYLRQSLLLPASGTPCRRRNGSKSAAVHMGFRDETVYRLDDRQSATDRRARGATGRGCRSRHAAPPTSRLWRFPTKLAGRAPTPDQSPAAVRQHGAIEAAQLPPGRPGPPQRRGHR
jgi:hypothetical protein